MQRRDFLTTTGATAAAITTPAFIGPFASSATLTELATSDRDELITHGDGNPSLIVRYDDAENLEDLRNWVEGYDDGRILREYPDLQMAALTVPWSAAGRRKFLGLTRYGGDDTLESLDYVSWADANADVSLPNPIDQLDESGSVSFDGALTRVQRLSLSARKFAGQSEYETGGLAFDGDAPEASLADARALVRADDTVVGGVDTSSLTVAVLDTGVDTSADIPSDRLHDESTNFTGTEDTTVGADGESAVADGDGHGTWVAHCINGFAPDATVLALKVLGDDGSGETKDIVAGIEKAASVGADVACLSLGSPMWSEALADALSTAAEEGVFAGVAVGNDRYGTVFTASPSDASDGFGVQATNVPESGTRDETKIAYFGNIGPDPGLPDLSEGTSNGSTPQIAAPGMNVNVQPEGALSGTSMAAPMVVGGAALLRAEGYTVKETRDRLTEYAHPIPNAGETETEHGLLDVEAALNGTEPETTQADARTDEAIARDQFNRQLSKAQGGLLARLF